MTEEEQKQILRNRGSMAVAAQGRLDLGSAAPAFPTNFSNINPPQTAPAIPFRGGGTAEMSVGGAQVNYPSRLGIAGGDYGTRFQFGAQEFGPARLPQASPFNFAGAQQQQTSIPIGGGPVSMGISSTPTAEQQGKTEIKTPYGSMWATPEQAANVMTPRTVNQQSSRSPAEQQAIIDQIRKNAPAINQARTEWVQNTIQQRRENPVTYDGGRVVPSNRFGDPIKAWTDMFKNQGRLDGAAAMSAPSTASTDSVLASTGFGAMQREQQESMPQPFGGSPLFSGMGYTAAFGGGPQPARSMMAQNDRRGTRTRFRRILGSV
jgi:hypothetical protein